MCSCFLELCTLDKYFEVKKQIKIKTMETYSLQKPIASMYFRLNHCDENHHIERIPIAVQNIDHLFRVESQITKAGRLHVFLLSEGTRIDDNEYLESPENGTELIVCTEEQIEKLLIIIIIVSFILIRKRFFLSHIYKNRLLRPLTYMFYKI